jgi:hypothetical protein
VIEAKSLDHGALILLFRSTCLAAVEEMGRVARSGPFSAGETEALEAKE